MTTPVRRASCSCGRLAVDCEGEPIRVSICHCTECQRRTGSVFGAQARFPRERVRVRDAGGAATAYRRVGDSGGAATFHFCATCGSTVYYELACAPEAIAVTVGSFADARFPKPRFSVYEARRPSWLAPLDDPEVEHWE